MKKIIRLSVLFLLVLSFGTVQAQKRHLDNYRDPDKRGVNVFEAPKDTISTFDGVKVRVGGSFALQYQAIDHSNAYDDYQLAGSDDPMAAVKLIELGNNFNLATANLDLDVALYDGVRMHLRTYLSSRHHPEPYVKGGYFQIDKLDFIEKDFLKGFMDRTTIKIGHMENNYGDAHFRRSDNAQAIFNPFVGNLIMDAFTTEVGVEVYHRVGPFFGMVGMTNGKLNQSVAQDSRGAAGAVFLAKAGFDKQFNEDLRFRLTGSLYNTGYVSRNYLYSADRAGSRYYLVMENVNASTSSNFRSGRFDPGFGNEITAIMFNPFVKFGGLEFFGTFETSSGKSYAEVDERKATQWAGELLYRFGGTENFYVGGRYNTVSAELSSGDDVDINRFNVGAGWFMTKNILAKLEYVNQSYDGYADSSIFSDGQFNGLVFEAVISF